eukprot:6501162-Alexandrium_andersonii.AAC.1
MHFVPKVLTLWAPLSLRAQCNEPPPGPRGTSTSSPSSAVAPRAPKRRGRTGLPWAVRRSRLS